MIQHARVVDSLVRLIPDAIYPLELHRLFEGATQRIWCSMFLIDLEPEVDDTAPVLVALRALAFARWRGVDVRLMIGGSRTNESLAEAAVSAAVMAKRFDIPTRTLLAGDVRGSHSKIVIADDWVLTGSHNWSNGAWTTHVQDSVSVLSPDLAALLANTFIDQWRRAAPQSEGA